MEEEKSTFAKVSENKEKKELNIEESEKKLAECQKQKDRYLTGWQRARADFLNYKKEEMERIGEILKYAGEELILKILPILDNFDLAEKKLPENLKDDENVKGILQVKNQILVFLKNQDVEEIKAVGEYFDPNFHEAAEMVDLKEEASGKVVEEIKKGYKLHGKVIRSARVKVTK